MSVIPWRFMYGLEEGTQARIDLEEARVEKIRRDLRDGNDFSGSCPARAGFAWGVMFVFLVVSAV
jgi:hypothetical protein